MRRSPVVVSAVLHVLLIVIAALGLPFISTREFNIPPPIVVDFVEIGKISQTPKVAPQPVPKEEDKPPAPAQAPKNASPSPVTPAPSEKTEDKKDLVKPQDQKEEDPNLLPEKKKQKTKKEEKKEQKDPQKDFSSVLKNLIDTKDKPAPKTQEPDLKADEQAAEDGQNAPFGEKLTMSEEDALRAQLEKCWNVPFGAKDVENMIVEVVMVINPDRTLREAAVVDQSRYNRDNFYRAAADSALRAVRSPLCSPFALPPDKYDAWKKVTITFNPKDMF